VSGRHQATTVQDIQEFSFKGYDQQPPGFSKPGFLFGAHGGSLEKCPRTQNFLGRLVWKLIGLVYRPFAWLYRRFSAFSPANGPFKAGDALPEFGL